MYKDSPASIDTKKEKGFIPVTNEVRRSELAQSWMLQHRETQPQGVSMP